MEGGRRLRSPATPEARKSFKILDITRVLPPTALPTEAPSNAATAVRLGLGRAARVLAKRSRAWRERRFGRRWWGTRPTSGSLSCVVRSKLSSTLIDAIARVFHGCYVARSITLHDQQLRRCGTTAPAARAFTRFLRQNEHLHRLPCADVLGLDVAAWDLLFLQS
jgi:hypothetical protein